MKKTMLLLTCLALIYPFSVIAEDNSLIDRFWAEVDGYISYRKTYFSLNTPDEAEKDFYFNWVETHLGVRFDLCDRLFFDPYLAASLQQDFGNKRWNKVYWNNNFIWGPGVRLEYDYVDTDNKNDTSFWIDNLILDLFTEYLIQEDSPDGGKDEIPADVSKENYRGGVSVWLSLDSERVGDFSLWGEMWGELAYGRTDFSEKGDRDFYNLYLFPYLGIKWDLGKVSLQPYYTLTLARDFGDKAWNKEPWLNYLEYGPGIRFSLGDLVEFGDAAIHIYTEYRNIEYFSRVDKSKYEDLSSYDYIAGVNFYLQFGAIKGTRIFH